MKRASVLGLLIGIGLLVVASAVPAPRGVDWGRVVQTAEQRAELGSTAQAALAPPPRHWGGVDGAEMGGGSSMPGVTVGLPRTVDSLGLPLYPPSSLPTSFYDNTEYDVAPLHMPLDLPRPAPPPAFIQQSARAYPTPMPAMQQQPQPQRFPVPIRYAPQQTAPQPIAPMLFEQNAMAMSTANEQADEQADEGNSESEADEQADEDSNEADDQAQAEGDSEDGDDAEDEGESEEEDGEEEEEGDSEEHSLLESGGRARGRMTAAANAQAAALSFLTDEQAMRSQSRSRIGMAQQTYLYGQALAPGRLPAREGLPNFAEDPQSVTARGPVPHFSALVRELPGQPVAPYAAFFEARSRLAGNNAYGVVPTSSGLGAVPPQPANYGRPLEPVLESLPPPPIVLAV